MFCNGKTVRDARRNKKRRRKKELRDRSSRRVMNHKENFDSPVDVRQASNDRERERERENRWKNPQMVRLPYFSASKGSFVFAVVRGNSFPSRGNPTRGSLLRLILCNTLVRKEFPLLFSVPRDCRPSSTGTFYRHGETGENYFSREKKRPRERERAFVYLSAGIPFLSIGALEP